ncbi:peptide chain release factor N(5)-glutamine methyltransferase [Rheinheimera sp. UJ63]|uniref:peptide chain release factor N(5)-glutamine methyltransferase n=1 Tax=Rheinheimera sp. UJ63 TaxID=2910157 RepID=UPI001F2EABD5|nr:peptide chain release factor N(5)-glutamine methyltransferase [Rheinheimera sp. UJ63]MCF4008128.1 peptide chain release factor N(5)-glutamine methyltransferase [Rheinheimera sp. UJ63]
MQLQPWLQHSAALLQSCSDNPLHEARLLLCRVLNCSSSFLYTYPERLLSATELQELERMLKRRVAGEPLAYIFGYWHFFGLELAVAPSTLIPRPDTEVLVEHVLTLPLAADARVLDLGTGTGAIALALASERPTWQITAVDLQPEAVALAQRNAATLKLPQVQVQQSRWFSQLAAQQYQLIVSNPPYIEAEDPHLCALRYEPLSALVAAEQGYADLQHIITNAPQHLTQGGWLWLEHGFEQAPLVRQMLVAAGFEQVSSVKDYGGHWRISGGQLN